MKIYVSGNYDSETAVPINAKGAPGRLWITRRQYQSAVDRLGLPDGDFLRLSPSHNDPGGEVIVYGPNDEPYAVIR